MGCTNAMLCILNRWNWSELSIKGMCSTTYEVLDIINDCSFMSLYMYQMFLPSHSGMANLWCDTMFLTYLVGILGLVCLVEWGWLFGNLWLKCGLGLTRCLFWLSVFPLQSIAMWLLSWNVMKKMFLFCIRTSISLERQCTLLFIWPISCCKYLTMSLFLPASV